MWRTEDEARTKWCVWTRSTDKTSCRASTCMMWVFGPDRLPIIIDGGPTKKRPEDVPLSYTVERRVDGSWMWLEPPEETAARRCGYCSVPGKPDEPYPK